MQRPTFAMAVCAALLLGAFAWSGFLPIQSAGSPEAGREVRPRLRGAKKVELRVAVVDAFGLPVAGAEVAGVRCDAGGHAVVQVASAPAVDLDVRAADHRTARLRVAPSSGEPMVCVLEPEAPWDEVEVGEPAPEPAASKGSRLGEGFVVGPDRLPVEGAFVVVAETGARARTDAAGHFEVPLDGGVATLIAQWESPDGRALAARSDEVAVGAKGDRWPLPELVLAPAATLRGVVRDRDGAPQSDVCVEVDGGGFRKRLRSGEGGAFRIAGLFAGPYRVMALPWRGSPGGEVDVHLVGSVIDCELRLSQPQPRTYRVVDPSGRPVPGAVVESRSAGRRQQIARADGEGTVKVRDARPEVELHVRRNRLPARIEARRDDDGELVIAAD